jgi:hypothetical protein
MNFCVKQGKTAAERYMKLTAMKLWVEQGPTKGTNISKMKELQQKMVRSQADLEL